MRPTIDTFKRGLVLALLLVMTVSCGLSPAWSDDGAVRAFASGVKAYREGDFNRAIDFLRRTVVLDPQNANARYYLAVSLDKLELDSDALPQYQYVIDHVHDYRLVNYAKSRVSTIAPGQNAVAAPAFTSDNRVAMAASTGNIPRIGGRFVVPLKSNRNALMVDGKISDNQSGRNTTGTFIIDTGATYTSISREMAEQLGLDLTNCDHVRITTANGRIDVPKVTIDRLSVNGLEARNVEATVIDVRKGSSFHGLLGLSFIRQFVLTIDPGSNQLIFQRP